MLIKGLNETDFVNYKKPAMFIVFPKCDFKCDKESGGNVCQNSKLANEPDKVIYISELVNRYINNPITSAIVCGGLEPMLSFDDLLFILTILRDDYENHDDFVIYTGYNKDEIGTQIEELKKFDNVIIKYGRFIPDSEPKYDEVLGVTLQSDNQWAERIS